MLFRSVGGDAELHIDYSEDEPQRLDRYIILSKGAYAGTSQLAEKLVASASPETVAASLKPAQHASDRAQEGTSLVIEIAQIPEANFDELSAAFEKLPLRRAPRDGENWDGFILKRTLYRSRYTTLKLAHDTLNDRDVVLKIPLPAMLHDQVFRAGFLREAWVGTTVHSPRIASYIDVPAERRSCLYLILPYYHGETLEARLTRPPPISYLDGIGLALKLCAHRTQVHKVSVMRNRDQSLRGINADRLCIQKGRIAGRRVARVSDGHMPGQLGEHFVSKDLRNQPHAFDVREMLAISGCNAG